MIHPSELLSLRQPSRAETVSHTSVHPRRLTPLEPPPTYCNDYPKIPSTRDPSFTQDYTVSTHLFPAAFPRCPADVWTQPPKVETKEETKARVQRTVELLSSLKEAQEQDRDTRPPMRKVFWTVANRYVHKSRPRNPGLTLVLLHGIGAHKEVLYPPFCRAAQLLTKRFKTWEPIIKRLLKLLHDCNTSIHIQEIWALDCVQHGDSGLLNESVMGDTCTFCYPLLPAALTLQIIDDCAEYARDLTNFLLAYLPEDVSLPGALPTNLGRLPDSKIAQRQKQGIAGRTIVGLGHSIGACSLCVYFDEGSPIAGPCYKLLMQPKCDSICAVPETILITSPCRVVHYPGVHQTSRYAPQERGVMHEQALVVEFTVCIRLRPVLQAVLIIWQRGSYGRFAEQSILPHLGPSSPRTILSIRARPASRWDSPHEAPSVPGEMVSTPHAQCKLLSSLFRRASCYSSAEWSTKPGSFWKISIPPSQCTGFGAGRAVVKEVLSARPKQASEGLSILPTTFTRT